MVVTMSREICMELYAKIVALRPEWHVDDDNLGFVKVVMDAGAPTPRSWARFPSLTGTACVDADCRKLGIEPKMNDLSLKPAAKKPGK